ncbi:hypothetical protein KCP75_00175 [Salmonella enterica subsp. enterica]|nr:hypothetical protein KCP75_00175 [Salmonella enterica subsp. enterica]
MAELVFIFNPKFITKAASWQISRTESGRMILPVEVGFGISQRYLAARYLTVSGESWSFCPVAAGSNPRPRTVLAYLRWHALLLGIAVRRLRRPLQSISVKEALLLCRDGYWIFILLPARSMSGRAVGNFDVMWSMHSSIRLFIFGGVLIAMAPLR